MRQGFPTCVAIGALTLIAGSFGLAQERLGQLPVSFEPNLGQTDSSVRFMARGQGMTVFFTDTEAVMQLQRVRKQAPGGRQPSQMDQTVVRMKLAGARAPRAARGLEKLPGISNYYLGNDPAQWRPGVPQYQRVIYEGVYPGVDMVCYGNQRNLEYDFVVAPGADPRQVQLAWEGVDSVAVNRDGDLVLATPLGEIVQKRPRVYQETASGRVEVAAKYVVAANRRVTFAMARYDRGKPLIIDPVLLYSTYLGGKSPDYAYAVAVDAAGEAYVTGYTSSSNFPLQSPVKTVVASDDVFVTKLSAAGNSLVYSTYLGGSGNDHGFAIAVDGSGAAYITGDSLSNNFPMLGGFQGASSGTWDAFVSKLSAAGALVYSTYLGGNNLDEGHGIAVDSTGAAYVAGFTLSTNFPTQSPIQGTNKGGYDSFVAKISPAGNSLVYSTLLGGKNDDQAWALAIDSSGSAYVTGTTDSTDFPTASPYQAALKAGDAFVTKLSPSGTSLVYSTFLGGSSSDDARAIAVDSSGAAYVTGRTLSADFPLAGALQTKNAGNYDVFVTKLAPAGNALVYSTYVGGKGTELANAIALDSSGAAYVAGQTNSTDFPTVGQFQTDQANDDAFAFKLTAAGDALVYSTYLGGSGNDYAQGIAVDPTGAAYVVGWTDSTDYPTQTPLQGAQLDTDAFVTKIAPALPAGTSKAQLLSPTPGSTLTGATVTFTWSTAAGATAYALGVGTGQTNFDIFDMELGLATSQTVTGIPINGSTIYVRLLTQVGGSVVFNDYTFKALTAGAKATMTLPAPGSVLTGSSVTFTWLGGNGASSYRLDVGTAVGQGDIFGKNVALATSQAVTGLPTNGSTVYVRLTTNVGTLTLFNDYTYTAAGGAATKAVITSPAPGSTLAGSSVTFTWTAGSGAVLYWLDVGTVAGGVSLFDQNEALATSQTVTGLPTDGSTIYVRLWTGLGSTYQYNDYTFKASGGSSKAVLTSPAPGSTLPGSSVTFGWTPGSGATAYYFYVGTVQGLGDIFSQNVALATSQAVTAIPTDGSTIYVRLWTLFGSTWQYNDYTFTASGGNTKAVMLLPAPGAMLSGGNVTFNWSAGSGATAYFLYVGTVQGLGDIFAQNVALATSQAVTSIPTNGSTVYVRLWTLFGSTWQFNDYTYTGSGATKAAITSPAPGSGFPGSSVTFTWTSVTGAGAYWLDIGTSAGGFELYSQGQGTATSQTVTGLPANGSTIYVRLWTAAGGVWGYNDYTYKASGGGTAAAMTAPVPSTVLSGASVTFTWSSIGGAGAYWLDIGTSAGGFDLYSQGQGTAASQTVTGLPTNGSTIYVRLWTAVGGVWQYNDYTYKAAG